VVQGSRAAAPRLGPFKPNEPVVDAPADGVEPVMRVEDIRMNFRGLKTLQDVSLEVAPGEIRGIVGPNGSGKTTLFNVVSGLYRPTAGRVYLAGRDVTSAAHTASPVPASPAPSRICDCYGRCRCGTTSSWRWTRAP
jgi:branched-chain amino acid transport system permease protein